jgi:hypothetical protein
MVSSPQAHPPDQHAARSTSRQPEGSSRRRHGTWRRLSPCPRSTCTANRTPECPHKPHMRRTARYSLGGLRRRRPLGTGGAGAFAMTGCTPRLETRWSRLLHAPCVHARHITSHHIASHRIPSCIGYLQRRRSAREDQAEWMPRHAHGHGHAHAPEPLLVRPPGTFPLPASSYQLQPALTRRWAPGP